ncbi:hypothetical protein CCHL11_02663 [Colletotrichum chlorophyti]|uniref:Uncharacterized protein n=1 Tax=Colletotrichum chlorophyti TaxID=708187 RepID=A0A1Q8S2Z5_9PEZI|nr:hypothetical protein CCHL11_02663 [Colletotrichum chlorophyti]
MGSFNEKCYMINGTENTKARACQRATDADVAAPCCLESHYCFSSGLCYDPMALVTYSGDCTDPKFKGKGCPTYCVEEKKKNPGARAVIFPCAPGRGSCTKPGTSCFEFRPGRLILNEVLDNDIDVGDVTIVQSSVLSTVTMPASTATGVATEVSITVTVACSESPTSCMSSSTGSVASSNGVSAGLATGIGVGVGVPLAVAVGALTAMFLREKKRRIRVAGFVAASSHMTEMPGSPRLPASAAPLLPASIDAQVVSPVSPISPLSPSSQTCPLDQHVVRHELSS